MRAHLLTAVKLLLLLLRPDLSSSLDQKSGLTIPSSNVGSIFWRDSFVVRGGSSKLDLDDAVDQLDADVDDEDGEIDEDDSDVLEEQRDKKRLDTKLTHSAMHSAVKVQVKKITETKEAVSSSLKMKKAKQKGKLLKALRLPYIIRAVMNPITVFLMTRAYFASLFNLNFMKEQQVRTRWLLNLATTALMRATL